MPVCMTLDVHTYGQAGDMTRTNLNVHRQRGCFPAITLRADSGRIDLLKQFIFQRRDVRQRAALTNAAAMTRIAMTRTLRLMAPLRRP